MAQHGRTPRQAIRLAMDSPERWVIEFNYTDARGNETHRTVSPVRWKNEHIFTALCLRREACRTFKLSHCRNIVVRPAADVMMGETPR